MKVRNVAIIIFYDKDKRILLQYRRGISKFGAEWGFFGGRIEKDETPEQAVVRETKEELTFDLKEYKYIGEYTYDVTEAMRQEVPDYEFDRIECKVFIAPLKTNLSKFKLK